jgi:malonate transporter and related proteins
MNTLGSLLASIVPTFGVVAIGWLCRYFKIWDKKAYQGLNAYALYIALPALIFQSLTATGFVRGLTAMDLKFLAGVLVAHIVVFACVAAFLFLHGASRETRAIGPMLFVLGNTAFLGIPYVTNTFGEQAAPYVAVVSVLLTAFIFISLANMRKIDERIGTAKLAVEFLKQPLLYAVALGLFAGAAGWNLPGFVDKTVAIFAGSASSVALLALGAFDYDARLKGIPYGKAIAFGFGKVFLTGTVAYLVLRLFGVSGELLAIGTAMSSVSIAVSAFLLAEDSGVGQQATMASIAISGVASFIALTLISSLWFSTGFFR